jgi:very-short-patch-repair endonuclease
MGYYCNQCKIGITPRVYQYSLTNFHRPLCKSCQQKNKSKVTSHAKNLFEALKKRGIKCKLESDDGYKTVDISIDWADLHIEVDGKHHLINPRQLYRDLERQFWSSEDGYDTIHVTNDMIEHYLDKVASSIAKVARKRYKDRYD